MARRAGASSSSPRRPWGGWEQHYARAPPHPADPARIAAEILRVSPAGETRVVQTLPLLVDRRIYAIEDGELRWYAHLADRSGGGVLAYNGDPALRQLADGTFRPVPPLPVALFLRPDERGAPLSPGRLPRGSNLTASHRIVAGRLLWQPTASRAGASGVAERATLLDERWLVLRETAAGLAMEERASDAAATLRQAGPLILGRPDAAIDLSGYTAPLLRAPDGSYWLLGRYGELVHADQELRRLDDRGPLARLGLLFSGFAGFYRDDFHTEHAVLKRVALALVLVAWPLLALALVVWHRLALSWPFTPSGLIF